MSYFKGRDDVYPYLSIDKNNPNIKYYIPKCANEWKLVFSDRKTAINDRIGQRDN